MKIECTIPALAVYDAVVSGLQGGVQYWGVTSVWMPARVASAADFETELKLVCDLVELDTGERIKLREQWAVALRLMAENTRGGSPRSSMGPAMPRRATS